MTNASRYVSTSKAAGILGVSTTLVKTLVDEYKLQAWKTQGGHRRISLDSIEAYLDSFEQQCRGSAPIERPGPLSRAVPATPQILVAVQTPELLASIRSRMDRVVHSNALTLPRLLGSPERALRELAADRPNIVVLEMTGSPAQQERILAPLAELGADSQPLSVLVVTRHPQLKLPELRAGRCCVHVFTAPVSDEWGRGCLAGMLTLLTSLQWSVPAAPRIRQAAAVNSVTNRKVLMHPG